RWVVWWKPRAGLRTLLAKHWSWHRSAPTTRSAHTINLVSMITRLYLGPRAMAACSCPKLRASSETNFSTAAWLSARLKAVGLSSSTCHEQRGHHPVLTFGCRAYRVGNSG